MIEKYRKLGVDIILTEEFKRQLVHDAFKLGLGARSIMSIFQNICDQYGVEYEIYTRNDLRKIIFNENALQGYPPVFVGEDDKILECSMVH